ncbi:hypothetical protein BGZ67_008619, partial [Mortierella alpina]
MYKPFYLVLLGLLGLLTVTVHAAPCSEESATDQIVFFVAQDQTVARHQTVAKHQIVAQDRAVALDQVVAPDQVAVPRRRGRTVRSAGDLNALMQREIDQNMTIAVDMNLYWDNVHQLCGGYNTCLLESLSDIRVELIPAERLSQEILCTTPSCTIGFQETTTVSTTHSFEAGFSAEMSAAPFGMGVTFTASVSYGFSRTNEVSQAFNYEFNLERGARGYIGMVNAQISHKLRVMGCNFDQCTDYYECFERCRRSPHKHE